MTHEPDDGSGQHRYDEIVEFGSGRTSGRGRMSGRPWLSRWLLTGLVLAAAVTLVLQETGHQARPAARNPSQAPPMRLIVVGHRLLGVTAGWELFARGPDDLVRVELARGLVHLTYVPPLETGNPDIAFVMEPGEAIIRSSDLVPGYVVPDGGQARQLAGPLAVSGPMIPGPASAKAVWVMTGLPAAPALSLVTLAGHRSGPSIPFPHDAPQLPATAVSDGRGNVLLITGNFVVYHAGPGWDRLVPGTPIAVGPASWLVLACNAQYQHCRNEVIDTASGSRRVLPGRVNDQPYYFAWPPTGVISPDGSTAAIAARGPGGKPTVHLIDLRTGATRDLGVSLGGQGSGFALATDFSAHSMAWSPDSRWLFVAGAGGKLIAIDASTGRAASLGVNVGPVDQVAVRA